MTDNDYLRTFKVQQYLPLACHTLNPVCDASSLFVFYQPVTQGSRVAPLCLAVMPSPSMGEGLGVGEVGEGGRHIPGMKLERRRYASEWLHAGMLFCMR